MTILCWQVVKYCHLKFYFGEIAQTCPSVEANLTPSIGGSLDLRHGILQKGNSEDGTSTVPIASISLIEQRMNTNSERISMRRSK